MLPIKELSGFPLVQIKEGGQIFFFSLSRCANPNGIHIPLKIPLEEKCSCVASIQRPIPLLLHFRDSGINLRGQ